MGNDFQGNIGLTLAESTPWWPERPNPADTPNNVLIVLLDDVGFADFGCYGSQIRTPTIDRLAGEGVRYTGFHTTAMCSTTRASLLTGRNHHSVGMGCLANFDSGFPGYRGKISADAPTIAELLKPHGYRNYMVGKWHATSVTETGPTGPFDGWPLGRGFDRFYGFLDAETDQYSPELVRDNSHVAASGNYESGYHLTDDLATEAVRYLADHHAASPQHPWFLMLSPGACHAPHQAPRALIDEYTKTFTHGWDVEREQRLARQIELGIVPAQTELCDRNDGVKPWADHSADEQRLFSRLAGAYAAMLDHFDQHLARVISVLETTGQLDDTIVMVLSDNGASQEGGPLGFVNAMAPFNMVPETLDDKIARIDDIGGPDTHSNFPHGWAMTSNTPLRRYKQNTHGGGVRDPLVIRTAHTTGSGTAGSTRDQFCHVSDLAPTLLDLLGLEAPGTPMEGTSFATTIDDANATTGKHTQYFEMFGHRGIWHDGWKAVAYHAPGSSFDDDRWELFDLTTNFNETRDLAAEQPDRLAQMIEKWWAEAAANQVLPLDDRFGERFAENAERFHGSRRSFLFEAGMGHLPSDVAPDLRSRSYTITADVEPITRLDEGVLIAHGDATCGYSLFMQGGHLVHDLNIGGTHQVVRSSEPVPAGATTLTFRMERSPGTGPFPHGVGTLLIDGEPAGRMETDQIFWLMISWSGLDIGLDRGTTVSDYDGTGRYTGPFEFTGSLRRVRVDLDDDQDLDHDAAGATELARE